MIFSVAWVLLTVANFRENSRKRLLGNSVNKAVPDEPFAAATHKTRQAPPGHYVDALKLLAFGYSLDEGNPNVVVLRRLWTAAGVGLSKSDALLISLSSATTRVCLVLQRLTRLTYFFECISWSKASPEP